MKKPFVLAVLLLSAVPLAGCAVLFPSDKDAATKNTPGFKAGYADGCSAATAQSANLRSEKYRNDAMYASDKDYRMGWANGYHGCRRVGQPSLPEDNNPLSDMLPKNQN